MSYELLRQVETPLFPEIAWDRPERADLKPRILIIGGSAGQFAATSSIYAEVVSMSGIASLAMPAPLTRLLPPQITCLSVPSTSTGSIAKKAEHELLDACLHHQAIVIASDIGHNSETSQVISALVRNYRGLAVIVGDALNALAHDAEQILGRPETVCVGTGGEVQSLLRRAKSPLALPTTGSLVVQAGVIHELTQHYTASIVMEADEGWLVADAGSTALCVATLSREATAARITVWRAEQPHKPFAAMVASLT